MYENLTPLAPANLKVLYVIRSRRPSLESEWLENASQIIAASVVRCEGNRFGNEVAVSSGSEGVSNSTVSQSIVDGRSDG